MTLRLLQAPTSYPLSVDDAKAHLRLDFAEDDDYVEGLIATATALLDGGEGILNRALLTQKWALDLEHFPHPRHHHLRHIPLFNVAGREAIPIPLSPLVSVESVTYFDCAGVSQTLDPTAYDVFVGRDGFIEPVFGTCWPFAPKRRRAVTISFTAGEISADAIPKPIKTAMLLLIGHYYEHREAVVGVENRDSSAPLPLGVDALIAPYRNWTV